MLADLKPRRKNLVFDLVEEAGYDTTDWVESFKRAAGYKANPKYCYEWGYVQPGRLIILNLWHSNMVEEHGQIVHRGTFRADAEFRRLNGAKQQWVDRARRLDGALQVALRENLPVRVIIVDGDRREKEAVDGPSSRVRCRELDPEPWTITAYDWDTGSCELTRGILDGRFVDQFDLEQTSKSGPERREVTTSSFVRDPAVRRRVLSRAKGRCELCGEQGFKMASGAVYLETHHIVPLADGGDDHAINVVALCANDHRCAHFGDDREEIARKLHAVANAFSDTASRIAVVH
ncbi:HNH endonuclease [Novosphingobium sp. 1949]|uniref:HNH endonuclease n=1 Tax=Novosphingobium organovorum TaxID=2930092 RepID=A0ABT0BFW3_9SPHN|nr:HNH endonuclease [Novosphingobium organovorum]MCJ2183928.1 HNH endonuclease [Novosphingobium organovorum]